MSGDDFLCRHAQSTELTSKNPAEVSSVNKFDIMSEAGREPGQSPDSQETISENNLAPEIDEKEISKNLHPDELQTSKGFFGNPVADRIFYQIFPDFIILFPDLVFSFFI